MRKDTKEAGGLTIGIDLGNKESHYHILTPEGEFFERGRFKMIPEQVKAFFAQFGRSRVAMEVGCQSNWVSRLAHRQGHEVLVANTRKLHMITKANYKTDTKDAEILADMAFSKPEWLHPVYQLSETYQEHMVAYEVRKMFVKDRTSKINFVRGKLKEYGIDLPQTMTTIPSVNKAKELVPEALQAYLFPVLELIQDLSRKIKEYTSILEELAQAHSETRWLRQVFGVGLLTSIYFFFKIGDPTRFERSRDVAAYLGLVPRRRQSGKQDPSLKITKAGDGELRSLLLQCVNRIMRSGSKDCDLRRFCERLQERGSANRAKVATARKLACLLHHLWVNRLEYDPDYQLKRQAAA